MPSGQQKIITTLRERRQIEGDLRGMLVAGSDVEFRRQAQRIASLGGQVIPAIVNNLDRADARLLAALGMVSTYLDHDQITRALRQAVLDARRTDQGRMAAMTILERFLGEEPDDQLLASLADPQTVALTSLQEALDRSGSNPGLLAEYVHGLDRQEPDIVLAIVRALRAGCQSGTQTADVGRSVELLRMIAQDVRVEIAAEALRALAEIRLPEAAAALQTLVPIVAPELRPLAERAVRKLQFVGVPVPAMHPPDPDWWALVSPVDGMGEQSVWFIRGSERSPHVRFLNVLLSDRAGAVQAVGHPHVSGLLLPPRRPVGCVHDVLLPGSSRALLMLVAPFDLGRRLVLEALAHNRETQIPVAATLRLLSPWLWSWCADALPGRQIPALRPEDQSLARSADQLLDHPAFANWRVDGEAMQQMAEGLSRQRGFGPDDGNLDSWVRHLAAELFTGRVVHTVGQRLVAMSEWLLLAGEEEKARMALAAAQSLVAGVPQDQPLIRALIRRDLRLALAGLDNGRSATQSRERNVGGS